MLSKFTIHEFRLATRSPKVSLEKVRNIHPLPAQDKVETNESERLPTLIDPIGSPSGPMEQGRPVSPLLDNRGYRKKSLARLNLILSRFRKDLFSSIYSDHDPEVVNLLIGSIKQWLVLFHCYGFDFSSHEEATIIRQIEKTFSMAETAYSLTGEWMDYFKYKNSSFIAAWIGDQILPTTPQYLQLPGLKTNNPRYLFGGPFYKFVNKLDRMGWIRSFSLSINMSKKGMPRPTMGDVKKAEAASFETMTTTREQPIWEFTHVCTLGEYQELEVEAIRSFIQPKPFIGRSYLETELKRTCSEVFRNFHLPLSSLTQYMLPSTAANVKYSRARLGAYGALKDLDLFRELCRLSEGTIMFRHRMTKLSGYISEYYGEVGRLDTAIGQIGELTKEVIGAEIDDSQFLPLWRKFYWKLVHFALTEPPEVRVVGLQEALKIRCISKGPPITYFVLKPLQKAMWKQLQRYWNFELTGTPITEELMNRRFGRIAEGAYRFHSGDYKAATDNLMSWVSNTLAHSICDQWEKTLCSSVGPFRELLERSLTGHIYLMEGDDRVLIKRKQERGQLMGSITSFPILCLANITLLRTAFEMTHAVRVKIEDLPSWVNGDDCLTQYTNPNFPIYWKNLGNVMGLTESLGKTFDSENFCTINSTTFELINGRWSTIPYINLGLIYNMKRSVSHEDDAAVPLSALELGPLHAKLLDTCGPILAPTVNDMFLYHNGRVLKSFQGPWFLPVWCCGAGLRPVEQNPTDLDLKRVRLLTELYGSNKYHPPKLSRKGEWLHYNEFQKTIRNECPLVDSYNYTHFDNDEEYGQAFILTCIQLWLQGGIYQLYNPHQKQNVREERYSGRLWSKVGRILQKREEGFVKPFLLDDLPAEPKFRCFPVTLACY